MHREVITLRLEADLKEQLASIAAESDVSVNWLLTSILRRWCQEYDEALARYGSGANTPKPVVVDVTI